MASSEDLVLLSMIEDLGRDAATAAALADWLEERERTDEATVVRLVDWAPVREALDRLNVTLHRPQLTMPKLLELAEAAWLGEDCDHGYIVWSPDNTLRMVWAHAYPL